MNKLIAPLILFTFGIALPLQAANIALSASDKAPTIVSTSSHVCRTAKIQKIESLSDHSENVLESTSSLINSPTNSPSGLSPCRSPWIHACASPSDHSESSLESTSSSTNSPTNSPASRFFLVQAATSLSDPSENFIESTSSLINSPTSSPSESPARNVFTVSYANKKPTFAATIIQVPPLKLAPHSGHLCTECVIKASTSALSIPVAFPPAESTSATSSPSTNNDAPLFFRSILPRFSKNNYLPPLYNAPLSPLSGSKLNNESLFTPTAQKVEREKLDSNEPLL